jgi:hypothetical protein
MIPGNTLNFDVSLKLVGQVDGSVERSVYSFPEFSLPFGSAFGNVELMEFLRELY